MECVKCNQKLNLDSDTLEGIKEGIFEIPDGLWCPTCVDKQIKSLYYQSTITKYMKEKLENASTEEIKNLFNDYLKYTNRTITPKDKKLSSFFDFTEEVGKILDENDFCKFALFNYKIAVGYDSENEEYHFWKLDQEDYDKAVSAIADTY